MKTRKKAILLGVLPVTLFSVASILAHSGMYKITSTGTAPAPAIVLDGVGTAGVGEWAGASPVTNIEYVGDPLRGHVWALHKADGIYLLVEIEDSMSSNNDTLVVLFDIDHSGGAAVDANDFGFEVRRDNTVKWGNANVARSMWTPTTNAVAGNPTLPTWTVELHLPTGAPSGLDLAANSSKVGIYFQIFDASDPFGATSAIYTQWPLPPDVNLLSDGTPNDWGNYEFDPATTFPSISVSDVRRGDAGIANYNIISFSATNRFDVQVNNPGGTAIANANPVRLNIYLAAIGIGEPWHRLDAAGTINADCADPGPWPSLAVINENKVCSGSTSLDDISLKLLADVFANTADYTIKKGVTRLDGGAVTIPAATSNYYQVLTWNLTGQGQDPYFAGDRAHQCMMAHVISPNDPNPADNTVQANMDFESLAGDSDAGGAGAFAWTMGNAGFRKYDPVAGKDMFLHVDTKNMNRQAGWDFQLEGVKPLQGKDAFVAHLVGKESLRARLLLKAPAAEKIGRTLKENLMVPAKAGGFQVNAKVPSGDAPVYVKVNGGTTLQIVNYAFTANDEQRVDLDGKGKLLPPNGPGGLPASVLQAAIQSAGEKFRLLLTPNAPLGALVGSWDNFQTAFLIGDGAQVTVPEGAKFLALGINDGLGFYGDNTGTGFRVKIIERFSGQPQSPEKPDMMRKVAFQQQPAAPSAKTGAVIPIKDVIPTLCINGYEDIGQKRTLGGTSHELFRYIGNVCWGIINVYPPNRSEKPDQGDAFDGPKPPRPKGCGSARGSNFALASFMTVLGIVVIRRRLSAKAKSRR